MPMPRVILAEYFMAPDVTLLFIGREDMEQPEVVPVELDHDDLRQFVHAHFGGQSRVSNMGREAEAEFHRRLMPLIRPILSWANVGDIIWFVPHDVLHYLPLHAVSINGVPLIDRNPVCYTPSASVMTYCQKRQHGRSANAFILGDSRGDLPYARVEAHSLAELFQTEPWVGRAVSREHVLKRLQEPDTFDVLHVACHGIFDSQDALRSGWLVSTPNSTTGTTDSDNRITCKDILQLALRANLVTLSACESGLSEQHPGDELIGLTRALIFAGTPSVVVSLWRVHDLSTSLLMEEFYRQWLGMSHAGNSRTKNKAQALQAAQNYVRHLTGAELVKQAMDRVDRSVALGNSRLATICQYQLVLAQTWANQQSEAEHTKGELERCLRNEPTSLSEAIRACLARDLGESAPSASPHRLDRPFENLYHWAPFVLIGDWR